MTEIKLDNSSVIDIPIKKPACIEAFFIFGLHKCGSSLLNKIFVDICNYIKTPCISIPETAFNQGIPIYLWNDCYHLNSIIIDGYCHRGFRCYPKFLKENQLVDERKKILLVRDPRDAVVSAYFSFSKSHRLPKSGQLLDNLIKSREAFKNIDVENYAISHALKVKEAFNAYHEHLSQNSLLKTYRYEDVIFDKHNWITDMLSFLGLSLDNNQISEIVDKHNIIPSSEDVNQHVRKVKPGDHRDKLSPECIIKVNEILSEVLDRYNYEY